MPDWNADVIVRLRDDRAAEPADENGKNHEHRQRDGDGDHRGSTSSEPG